MESKAGWAAVGSNVVSQRAPAKAGSGDGDDATMTGTLDSQANAESENRQAAVSC